VDRKIFSDTQTLIGYVEDFMSSFQVDGAGPKDFSNGFFGMLSFEGVSLFEDIKFQEHREIPFIHYTIFQNVLVFDHFSHSAMLYCFSPSGESNLEEIEQLLDIKTFPSYGIKINPERISNLSDEDYLQNVGTGKKHCHQGDVFQVVLSREYNRSYSGDEFNLYRSLRSVNPSPYMFYFDLPEFKLLGSSPESQVKIEGDKVIISPIAGTVRRTGQDEEDRILAQQLTEDPKESAEHVMLVDLARNDLGKVATEVEVERFRELHYYSHVIHLVSKVVGKIKKGISPIKVLGETFPAGTLSGAPKYRAMEIIRDLEGLSRGMYGGSIGFIGLDGSMNQAIFIRSVLCSRQKIHYRAGAGVVNASVPEKELQEVEHKLGAIELAIERANENFGI
ncbi:MAG: anthranilate synthase component I family protein, partial [Luteibaculum sp.]